MSSNGGGANGGSDITMFGGKKLTAVEFATIYAGRVVLTPNASAITRGRVVGYRKGSTRDEILVESPTAEVTTGWNNDVVITVTGDVKLSWYVPLKHVANFEVDDRVVAKIASAYPHKCPRCQAPAYIGFTDISCSKNCQGRK